MPPCTAAKATWPEPAGLALRLGVAFPLAIALIWLAGRPLVNAMLPLIHTLLGWIDDRFAILYLGLDHTSQDTVIRLRVNLMHWIVLGTRVVEPEPQGWLEVTTTLGAMLQPLVIALGLTAAWPGNALTRCWRVVRAALLGLLFMLVDIPLTLHAYVWDMLVEHYDPQRLSALMVVHRFLHGGGRLGVGVLLAVLAVAGVTGITRWRKKQMPSETEPQCAI